MNKAERVCRTWGAGNAPKLQVDRKFRDEQVRERSERPR